MPNIVMVWPRLSIGEATNFNARTECPGGRIVVANPLGSGLKGNSDVSSNAFQYGQ